MLSSAGKSTLSGIDELLVFVELEVEVRAGASTRGTDVADDLSLGHGCAGANPYGKAVQMGIPAHVCRVVLDIDRFAIRAIPAGFADDAVTDGTNRSAPLRREIDACVRQIGL